MAKMRFERNGGQRVINTIGERSSSVIRKLLIERTSKGESISEILLSLNGKDVKFAQELLFADDEISKLIRPDSSVEEQKQEETKPRVFNKTKLMKQEADRVRMEQEQELLKKIQQLKNMRAA